MSLPSLPVITPIAQHIVPIWNVFYFLKGPARERRREVEGEFAGLKRLVTGLVRRVEKSARRLSHGRCKSSPPSQRRAAAL